LRWQMQTAGKARVDLASARGGFHGGARRRRWPLVAAAVTLISLLAAAFLLWGPIGLGSGPLTVDAPSGGQILGPRDQAWGMMVPVRAGTAGAVIDQVTVVGGAGYGRPRVLSVLEVRDRPGQCGGTFRWQGSESILSLCAVGGLHRLIGARLPGNNPGVDMVIKVGSSVSPGGCWTVTAIVVRYHVGIRHYTLTSTADFAACKTAAEETNADLALGQPN
jgi:hypothetical protein